MKRIYKILGVCILSLVLFFLGRLIHQKTLYLDIFPLKYRISLSYNERKGTLVSRIIDEGYREISLLEYTSLDPEGATMVIKYTYENFGDDPQQTTGDTGGELWPPQAEDLYLDEKTGNHFVYLQTYLGKDLYISKFDDEKDTFFVYQKIGNRFTRYISFLNQKSETPNYLQNLMIYGEYPNLDIREKKKIYDRFLRFFKKMDIQLLKKPE